MELRECPFCGKKVTVNIGENTRCLWITCECGIETSPTRIENDMIKHWNTRSITTPKHETVEELREKFHTIWEYTDNLLYQIVYDPGCVYQYEDRFKSFLLAYLAMGVIDKIESRDIFIPDMYFVKPVVEG